MYVRTTGFRAAERESVGSFDVFVPPVGGPLFDVLNGQGLPRHSMYAICLHWGGFGGQCRHRLQSHGVSGL